MASGPLCVEPSIPADEKGLGEVGLLFQSSVTVFLIIGHWKMTNLDTPALMMHVMVFSIVPECPLEWIKRNFVSAVVINSFKSTKGEEEKASLLSHSRDLESKASSDSIHEESFKWVVVESPKGIWAV